MISKIKTTILLISGLLLLSPAVGFAQGTELDPVNPATWIFGILLVILVVVGVILAKVKANKNKENIRRLMEEMKEE